MAADISSEREQMKPCCAQWKDKYVKLEERRKALRQAVKLLEQQAYKFQLDNINLKKAYEEVQSRSKIEREEQEKKSDVFTAQEKEISSLKSEVFLLKQRNVASSEDGEKKFLQERICEAEREITNLKELLKKERKKAVAQKKESTLNQGITLPSDDAEKSMLQVRLSDCEGEINKLTELLDIEKLKTDAEKKAAIAEKNRATAAWKIVKEEKSRARDERLEAKAEKEKAEEYRTLLESLKNELDDTKLKFASEAAQFELDKKKLKAECQKATKQKNNVGKVLNNSNDQKLLTDLNSKVALKEKQRADCLDKQLAEEKLRVDELCKEIHQLQSSMKAHPLATETISPANEKGDLYRMNTNLEHINVETINKKEKSRTRNVIEEKQVDKSLAVSVICEIPKTEILKLDYSKSSKRSKSSRSSLSTKSHGVSSCERVKFLNKQLKFEKLQTKQARKTAKLEKDRTQVLFRELSCMKQEFVQFLYRIDILEGHCSLDTEGIRDFSKIPLQATCLYDTLCSDTKKSKIFHVPASQLCIKGKNDLVVSDNLKQVIKDNSPSFTPSCGNCSKPGPADVLKIRSPYKGDRGKILHSYANAIDSSAASFSDPQMTGSQEKGCISVLTSTELESGKETHLDKLTNENGEPTTAVSEKIVRVNRKRKKAPHVVESVEHAHPRSGGLQTDEVLNSMPNTVTNREVRPSKLIGNVSSNQSRTYKKRKKAYKKDETISEKELATRVAGNAEYLSNTFLDNSKKSPPNSHAYGIDCMYMNDFNVSTCFTDYMKLFELDSASEEERFRNVIEMPLSPTVPDIKFPDCDILTSKSSVEPFNEVTRSEQQWLSSSYDFNVANVLHENDPQKVIQQVHNADCSDNKFDRHFDSCNAVHMQEGATCTGNENTPKPMSVTYAKHFIFSPDLKNISCVSRIYCAVNKCAAKCRIGSGSESLMTDILCYLPAEDYLLPREKAGTLFTLLLNHYVLFVSDATGDFCSSPWLSSRSSCFHLDFFKGIKSIFIELCDTDTFFTVIDSFFTNREVLEYKDAAEIDLAGNFDTRTMISFNFDSANITLCTEPALPVHVAGGSIILTLFCEALDQYSFMCELSYKILYLNRFDSELALCILHVFAKYCGKKYLESTDNVLTMIVIKSLVTFMEKENPVVSDHSSSKTSSVFPQCDSCLFAEGALYVDNIVLLLLEKIQRCPLVSCDLTLCERAGKDSAHEQRDSSEACCLHDLEMKTIPNDYCTCHIVDVLSLLEIIALKMSWEWTCRKIVSPLFEIMESLKNSSILVLIATLIGEVGRMGVHKRGYADAGVHQLRQKLLLLLDSEEKSGFRLQLAAAQAMLSLLPFPFKELPHCSSFFLGSDLTPLKTWFYSLSSQQKSHISLFC